MSSGIAWAAISAALLAKAHPLGAIFSALVLAFLDAGTRSAMIHSTLNLELGGLIQGVFFLFISISTMRKHHDRNL
jgi:ABC-type uncharacterized transport system permease subunit